MSRESEVVAYLRADSELGTLLPGGVYGYSELGTAGLTDRTQTPDVWTGGVFQACAIVRQRAAVPTGQLQSVQSQRTSTSQVIEIWTYALTDEAIEAAQNQVYYLMMGKRLTAAFSATWAGGLPDVMPAPELPSKTLVGRNDYRIVFIRRASAA